MSNGEAKILPAYKDAGPFNLASEFTLEAFQSALNYKPRSDDLFVVTYPKCGTTWVQNIVALIHRNGKPFASALEFFSSTPFLELTGADAAEKMKRPAAIKVHLPFNITPYSPDAKYIFVARNPKDCCVSFYHHTTNIPMYKFEGGQFDDYFELFMEGKVDFGDYFDTLLSWYEHKDDPNVLFITYEELKANTEENVLKIAEFMGQNYKDALESDPNLLKDVIHYSSFSYMQEFLNKQMDEMFKLPPEVLINNPDVPEGIRQIIKNNNNSEVFSKPSNPSQFVRKGIVGDWRNHFSEEQDRRMKEKFHQKTKGTDLELLWKSEMNL